MMNRILKLSLFATVLFSCTPQPFLSEQRDPQSLENTKKNNSKQKRKIVKSNDPAPETPASAEPAPLPAEDVNLYLKVSDLQTNLSVPDLQRVRRLAAISERSTLSRGILLVAALRSYVGAGIDSVLFEQAELTERTPLDVKDWTKAQSLEGLALQLNISFKTEFESNPFVQDLSIYDLTLRALDKEDKASDFANALRSLLNDKAAQWAKVHEKLTPAPLVPEKTKAPIAGGGESVVPSSEVSPAAPTTPPEIANATVPVAAPAKNSEPEKSEGTPGGDGAVLLKKAQELSEKNKFHESIKLLRSIEPASTFHATATVKIRDVANKAVSDLRTKAARAYQSAVPVNDLKARGAYLEEAKKFLLTAIEQYPESDQLDSVKQNLSVIKKSLDVINRDLGR